MKQVTETRASVTTVSPPAANKKKLNTSENNKSLTLWHTIFTTHGAPINTNFLGENGEKRSNYSLKIDTIYTYDIPFDRSFLRLSNGIRPVMPSIDRKLKLKAKDIDGSDRLTTGCVLTDLASPAVSRTGCVWVIPCRVNQIFSIQIPE
jgi:hypothetical protein